MILLMIMMNLLDKLWIIPEDSIVETGAIASSFIENIDVSSLLHQQPGAVQVTLGQSVVQRSEGRIIGCTIDISSSLCMVNCI